jgi:hypothetical protein
VDKRGKNPRPFVATHVIANLKGKNRRRETKREGGRRRGGGRGEEGKIGKKEREFAECI